MASITLTFKPWPPLHAVFDDRAIQGKKQPYHLWPYSLPHDELTWLETFEFEAASREAGTNKDRRK